MRMRVEMLSLTYRAALVLLVTCATVAAPGTAQSDDDREDRPAASSTHEPTSADLPSSASLVPGAAPQAIPAADGVEVAGPAADHASEAPDSTGDGAPARQEERWTDPWGQPRNLGMAIFTAYMGNFIPWAFNEVVPSRQELKISQISPRSWWRNIEAGWKWDDNAFQVNFFAHPFQGNIYHTAARSNGYGYWTGLLFALAGSFHWECCGETHFMSVNDWVNTAVGGAAVGEMMYRASSLVLDNEARGRGRVGREVAGFLLTPTRGFTRLVSGNASRVYDNPEHPSDHVPDHLEMVVSGGMRGADTWRTGRGGRLDENVPNHGYVNVEFVAGELTELDRQQPFDYMRALVQVNFVRGRQLGRIIIRGNLWHHEIARSDGGVSMLAAIQDFDYENNTVFEYGGQGATFLYLRQSRLSPRTAIDTKVGATWMLLGGVKSELAFLADVEGIRERFREYDFGLGPGFRVGGTLRRDGRRVLEAEYKFQYMKTLNGSTYEGQGSDHRIQNLVARGILPWNLLGISVGAQYNYFRRHTDFEIAEIGVVEQRAHEWQVFGSWYPNRDVD